MEGLRPEKDYELAIKSSIKIRKDNPFLKYRYWPEAIGRGSFGNTMRAARLSDGKEFALKFIKDLEKRNLKQVLKEAQLMAYFDCEELV